MVFHGVMAIIITIMVINIPLPDKFGYTEILALLVSILVFFVSFFIVGIYWHQHYRLFLHTEEISSTTSWRNLFFLFFLSLIPVFTKWVIENPGEVIPCFGYETVFLFVNLSYRFMLLSVIYPEKMKKLTSQRRVPVSLFFIIWIMMIVGVIVLSFFQPLVSIFLFIGLPLVFSLGNMWDEKDKNDRFRQNEDRFKRINYKFKQGNDRLKEKTE